MFQMDWADWQVRASIDQQRHLRSLPGALLALKKTQWRPEAQTLPTHVKHRHGQVERLLILGATGHSRP
jgi:hypothetical protein